jgi:hypothetical protein
VLRRETRYKPEEQRRCSNQRTETEAGLGNLSKLISTCPQISQTVVFMRHELSKKNIVCFLFIITIFLHYLRPRACLSMLDLLSFQKTLLISTHRDTGVIIMTPHLIFF